MHKHFYADIEKVEPQSDGSVKVYGWASTPARDVDGEIVTADAMRAALPEYMQFGAVREMHQPKAAGTAIEARVEDDGRTWFGAHVVDSEAVKKIQANVYKGFSIGGRVLTRDEADPDTITAIRLVEVSLVDRPANPEAVFTMFKADGAADAHSEAELAAIAELQAIVNKGEITPSQIVELIKAKSPAANDGTPATDSTSSFPVEGVEGDVDSNNPIATDGVDQTDPMHVKDDDGDDDKADDMDDCAKDGDDAEMADKAASGDDLKKVAGDLLEKVNSLMAANNALIKRIEALEAQPAPAKAALKVVSKGEDISKSADAAKNELPATATPFERAAYEMRKVHASGGLIA